MRKLVLLTAAALSTAALGGCVYTHAPIRDPGVLPSGSNHLIASTGSATSMPIYSMSNDDLANHPDTATATQVGSILSAAQLRNGSGANTTWIDTNCGSQCGLWAPEIKPFGSGYVAYFSARSTTGLRCIGMATSSSPTGGFALAPGSGFCSPGGYDLIDPTEFTDTSGQAYLLYKQDKKLDASDPISAGDPNKRKAIAITTLNSTTGLSPSLASTRILTPKPGVGWETTGGTVDDCTNSAKNGWPSVEAPTMIRRDSFYYLFYSGNGYCTKQYGIGVARCNTAYASNPMQCDFDAGNHLGARDPANPIITGDYPNHCGTGHQDVADGGGAIFYHTYIGSSCTGERYLAAQPLDWSSDGWPVPRAGRNP